MYEMRDIGCLPGNRELTTHKEILFESHQGPIPRALRFSDLVEEISAHCQEEIIPALRKVDSSVANGMHAAGFLCYEAASGIDRDLPAVTGSGLPLLWFGIFRKRSEGPPEQSLSNISYMISGWTPSLSAEKYRKAADVVREYIASGDCYQVNFTMRLRFGFSGDPFHLYRVLCGTQRTRYSAYLDVGGYSILSVSPELFFRLDRGLLTVCPMKGTCARGRWPEEDADFIKRLQSSAKERAENVMIVDLLRNDLGRVSLNGSVTTTSLFDVEAYETVHQMTSTVSSVIRPGTGLTELMMALFPCGSVTGAPKKRSMEIIAELENSPRGLYTGCIGYVSPGMDEAVFSVAIRSLVIDREAGAGELGVGSGITWDSNVDAEYEECLAKGLFARNIRPEFKLIESILFEEEDGYFLLEPHMDRLCRSARYFGFMVDKTEIVKTLDLEGRGLRGRFKVRIELSRQGVFQIEANPLEQDGVFRTGTISIAEGRVDSSDPFLYHKTGNREIYRREAAKRPDCIDVIFLNERGEITEGANNNIVIRKGAEMITPRMECGLLPGTFRQFLLDAGEIKEGIITVRDLETSEEIYLINSVRKWRRVFLAEDN